MATGAKLTKEEIQAGVKEVMALVAGIDKTQIGGIFTDQKTLDKDLKFDDLDRVEMCIELEERFGIPIPDERIDALQDATVGDVVKLIVDMLQPEA